MTTSSTSPEEFGDMHMMVSDLPAADVDRLAAFLRIGSDRLRHRWLVTDNSDAKLYVFGGESAPTMPASLDQAPALIRVVDGGTEVEAGEQVLVRPIQFEAFVEAMVRAEAAWSGPPALQPPPAPEPGVVPAPDAVSADAAVQHGAAVRLRRWPRADMLGQSRYGVRMASFLSARHLSVADLAELSNVEPAECARFVALLAEAGLLKSAEPVAPKPAAPVPEAAQPAEPPAVVAAASAEKRSLLGRLRNKLGLGLKAR